MLKTIIIILGFIMLFTGGFMKYKHENEKEKISVLNFVKSKSLANILILAGSMLFGVFLFCHIVGTTEMKNKKTQAANALELIEAQISYEDVIGGYIDLRAGESDAEFTEEIRKLIKETSLDSISTAETLLSQYEMQSVMSSKSYIRILGGIERKRYYSEMLMTANEPAKIYKNILDTNQELEEYIKLETEYLKGDCSEKKLGDYIGKGNWRK